ncbi:MAG TPA: cytochrome c [Candidatus Acidoferrum sp.]|nr:cytochrome c [Candidatus Acidoferrum sp.]
MRRVPTSRWRDLLAKRALLCAAVTWLAVAGVPAHAGDDSAQQVKQGKKLFEQRCGFCHLAGGTGTIMLARRLGKERSLLSERTDLSAEYIQKITRVGINSMPPHNRIEVPDSELNLITTYLTRPASARTAADTGSTSGTP